MGQPQQQPVAGAIMTIASVNTANLFIANSFPHCLVLTADNRIAGQPPAMRDDVKNRQTHGVRTMIRSTRAIGMVM